MRWNIQSSRSYMLICIIIIIFIGVCAWQPARVAQAQTTDEIRGAAYLDHNANGIRDVGEPGVENMVVYAIDEMGNRAETVTGIGGFYVFNSAENNLTGHVRIEFMLPDDDSLDGLEAAPVGGSSVQFADLNSPTADIDAGFFIPSESCSGDPLLVTSCFVFGDQITGENKDGVTSVAVPYGVSGIDPIKTHMATAQAMGSTYGIAVQQASQRIFAASYVKTHTGLGPGAETATTTGGIYEIKANERDGSATAELFIDLNALGFDTGSDPHPSPDEVCAGQVEPGETNLNCWVHDLNTFPLVGRRGFGDMDFSADQTHLYVTNLNTKKLIELPVGNPATVPDADDILVYDIPSTDCADADAVPFGLGTDGDAMYLGITCTGETSRDRDDLQAIVYRFDRGDGPGSESYEAVLTINLAYSREGDLTSWCRVQEGVVKTNTLIAELGNGEGCPTDWHVWTNSWDDFAMVAVDYGSLLTPIAPQPILSDIDFDGSDMLIAFRDRTADQFGNRMGNPTDASDPQLYEGVSAGDLLRACLHRDEYLLEEDGVCGGIPGGSTTNGEGPGIGEYYLDERVFEQYHHRELFMGGIVQIDGRDAVASTATAPVAFNEAGIGTWNNLDGTQQSQTRLYQTATSETFFGKANGLGDLEAICPLPSLALGNRVWCDSDQDGIQDGSEAGVPLMQVTLNCGENDVTVRTDQTGNYLFTDQKYASEHDGGLIPRSAECVIMLDFSGETGEEIGQHCGFLDETLLTEANVEGDTSNAPLVDIRDSDAEEVDQVAMIFVTTGESGQNNHALDIGFTSDEIETPPVPVVPTVIVPTAVPTLDTSAVAVAEILEADATAEVEVAEVSNVSEEADLSAEPAQVVTPVTSSSFLPANVIRILAAVGLLSALGLWWRSRAAAKKATNSQG